MTDEIEAITTKRRQKIWDNLQKYYDQLEAELQDPTRDPDSTVVSRFTRLQSYDQAQTAKSNAIGTRNFLTDNLRGQLSDAHTAGIGQKLLCATQICGSIIAGIVGASPAFTGAVGAAAKAMTAASGAIQGGIVGGAQTIAGFSHTYQQGVIADRSAAIKLAEQKMQEEKAREQTEQRQENAHADDEKRQKQAHHEAVRHVLSLNQSS